MSTKIVREFSRFASQYGQYSMIQEQVAAKLVRDTDVIPRRIIDLGCGNGAIYRQIHWPFERFLGIDLAEGMVACHPKGSGVECVHGDFNDLEWLLRLESMGFEHIYSASALQWAEDLDALFETLSLFNIPLSLGIFTCNTFKTLYATADLPPLLRSADTIMRSAQRLVGARFELVEYTLAFESKQELFGYIKRSGVSGGRNVLSYSQTKRLIQEYPHLYLEFEVLFIYTR